MFESCLLEVFGEAVLVEPEQNGLFDLEKVWALAGKCEEGHPNDWCDRLVRYYTETRQLVLQYKEGTEYVEKYYATRTALVAYYFWLCTHRFDFLIRKLGITEKSNTGISFIS